MQLQGFDRTALSPSQQEEVEALERELAVLQRIERTARIFTIVPNRPQRALFSSKAAYRCFFGGNKSGKSTGGIWEDCAHMVGFRPWLPPDHPDYLTGYEPPCKGMIFAETWDKADEIHTPMFQKWIPAAWGPKPIKRQGQVRGWKLTKGPGKGSEIRYATYEMDWERLEGADKIFYHFDEPPPYSHWSPVKRGIVAEGGRIWLTLTLLSEGWIWDEIWEQAEAGDPDYFGVVGDIRDNIYDPKTGSGYLTEENVARFEKGLDESEREVRIHGKPQHLQGRVFKQFRAGEPWVIDPFDIPDDWPTIRAIDPALAKPVAVLWARISPSGRLFITDELFDQNIKGMDELRARIQMIEKERRHNVVISLMDEAGEEKNLDGVTMFKHFAKYGIHSTPAPRAGRLGQMMDVAEGFKIDPFMDVPGIQIFKNCKRLVWEVKQFSFPSVRNATSRWEKYRDLPTGKDKKNDDLVDCLKMIRARNPDYSSLQPENMMPTGGSPDVVEGTFAEAYGTPWADGEGGYTDGVHYRGYA